MLNFYNTKITVAGADEAGRGCLAGPVTAAAVILPIEFKNAVLNDSKTLNLKNRNFLKSLIEDEAITYGVAHVFMKEIDEINILNASILAMHRALQVLKFDPDHIIVDGNRFKPYQKIPHECIIKGDGKYMSIAAASILAKTYRDEFMEKIHEEFPDYNWKKNKGYPTKEHRAAIKKYGVTKYHRKSFKLLPDQLKIDF
ncbi:ribonuclease HII [Christiangramia forsetii]|uniref:Ribonuclease HII n=2 Tax=Christiangramia forsetii TaxID=411153 RepID=RNH2_CHRFK|nr:ribonuclease HII [Christiangramia forsetii]A0M5H5.1 RecName: Full=Ribonuclease HII; Short=RNase HII [Christiangramia forsetii KT0803]GGG32925.1 ribonuclease HII [Christiangramia forsetii]CAL67870.1 ribonuclease HII [Christiangramia forsetii KT0803]